jgi:endonuclease
MDLIDAQKRFSHDLSESKTIILVCRCEIEYWGRSRSVIGLGDRIIFFKPDSTIIVHSPKGFKPLNWMSPPTDTTVTVDGGIICVFSQRTLKPYEELRIRISKVMGYNSYSKISDTERIDVTHTEKDMRDYLEKNPAEVDECFRLKDVERKTQVGLIDLSGKNTAQSS